MTKFAEVLRQGDERCALTNMTSFSGRIMASYDDLEAVLGKPTYIKACEKTQIEWVVMYGDEVFTVYDYKCEDDVTDLPIADWHIGSHGDHYEFVDMLRDLVWDMRNERGHGIGT